MFRAVFVKNGIRIVEVDQDFAAFAFRRELLQQAARPRQRHMADFARAFAATARAHQFVVAPEGPVNQSGIGGFHF